MFEFSSGFLMKVRKEALRRRVWFRVLDGTERALLYLVPRCMERPKNAELIDALARIIVKLKWALKSQVASLACQVGRPLAEKLSLMAQGWGHMAARAWAWDEGFWRYLAIVNASGHLGSRIEGGGRVG